MIRSYKPVIVLLGALTALDLVSAVLASRVTGTAKPPPPAVVSMLILAVLTLAAMYGLWRGARWGAARRLRHPGLRCVERPPRARRPSEHRLGRDRRRDHHSVAHRHRHAGPDAGRRTCSPARNGLKGRRLRTAIANARNPDKNSLDTEKRCVMKRRKWARFIAGPTFGITDLGWGDIGLAVFLSVFATIIVTHGKNAAGHVFDAGWAGALAVLLMTLPVAFARKRPLVVAWVLVAGALVNWLAIGTYVRCGATLPAVFYMAFVVGSRCEGRERAIGEGLVICSILIQCESDPQIYPLTNAILFIPISLAFLGAGYLLHRRNVTVETLRVQDDGAPAAEGAQRRPGGRGGPGPHCRRPGPVPARAGVRHGRGRGVGPAIARGRARPGRRRLRGDSGHRSGDVDPHAPGGRQPARRSTDGAAAGPGPARPAARGVRHGRRPPAGPRGSAAAPTRPGAGRLPNRGAPPQHLGEGPQRCRQRGGRPSARTRSSSRWWARACARAWRGRRWPPRPSGPTSAAARCTPRCATGCARPRSSFR